ncbi:MAG: HlyD family efflux transporter periplasmic adaptor subunit [Clostridiaceae bacterium]
MILVPTSGKLHLSNQITNGMVLQGGTLIGSITTTDENLVVETLLPSTDRPRIHVNDDVELAVGGLNQAEYGTIKVKPENTFLQDNKGEKVNLTLRMVTETRVKYEKITYMKYFLEQIGIKLN